MEIFADICIAMSIVSASFLFTAFGVACIAKAAELFSNARLTCVEADINDLRYLKEIREDESCSCPIRVRVRIKEGK